MSAWKEIGWPLARKLLPAVVVLALTWWAALAGDAALRAALIQHHIAIFVTIGVVLYAIAPVSAAWSALQTPRPYRHRSAQPQVNPPSQPPTAAAATERLAALKAQKARVELEIAKQRKTVAPQPARKSKSKRR